MVCIANLCIVHGLMQFLNNFSPSPKFSPYASTYYLLSPSVCPSICLSTPYLLSHLSQFLSSLSLFLHSPPQPPHCVTLHLPGSQRYSDYKGYATSFEWAGGHNDKIPR